MARKTTETTAGVSEGYVEDLRAVRRRLRYDVTSTVPKGKVK